MTTRTPKPNRTGSRTLRTLVPASLALLTASVMLGQAAPAPAPATPANTAEETIELSPFVTTASSDKGYVATSSLAGSRVNTPLKDIAAQIDVMTPEFLNDIGATSVTDALAFSTNNGGPTEQNVGPNDSVTTTRNNGRARGFDAITNSQDFYETNLPSDLYNADRLTIANGPQSILFGLGNAGGAIDVSTKRAIFRNRNEIGLRTDENGSLRGTLDINRELIDQTLAIRVAAVRSDGKGFVDGSFNRQARIFGTITYRPFRSTTVRVSAENIGQKASNASNYISKDFVTPWAYSGAQLFDNSTGNGGVNNTAFPYLGKNTNTLRVLSYGAVDRPSVLVWNGAALTRGPGQLPNAIDTRAPSLLDNSIYPTDHDVRVGGRVNRLRGQLLRGAIEQKITRDLFVELGFNYETTTELAGGPFNEAESINIFADPNKYLPGGSTKTPQTALNPNAGKLYIETYPSGSEGKNLTKETRLTTSYEFDFARHFDNFTKYFGRHRLAGLLSSRVDEDRSQASRAIVLDNPSWATGDLLNNSRYLRTRYYLSPQNGVLVAEPMSGGNGAPNSGWFGPWTITDTTTNETANYTMFDHPAGRTSATGGSRKEITTYMLALQSFFFHDKINLFAGRRVDDFKSYLIAPWALVRGDQLAPGDKKGMYAPLSQVGFDTTPSTDDSGKTYSYGGVWHALRWVSLFASKSDNTALPPGYLDPWNRPLKGIYSDGYDYGFRLSMKDDAISMRVNFYKEQQHNLIGDAQAVRTAANTIEQRLRGPDRPAGIADVPADGYDPVARGVNAYRSVEDKIGRGVDITLVARITPNWDARVTVGKQKTHVFNKSLEFNTWVAQRLPAWQNFGGLGWDKVTISTTSSQTVHDFYNTDVQNEIIRSQMRNDLPRFRQHEWRASLFTNYRFTRSWLRGFNVGGGARWLDKPNNGYVQMVYPDGTMGDDIHQVIYGFSETYFDLLLGYGNRMRVAGHNVGWRVQLNVRNVFDHDNLTSIRSSYAGGILEWGRVEPRQAVLSTSLTF